MKKLDISTVDLVGCLPPEHCAPGVAATEFDPGDFILVEGKSLVSRLINFGQKLRIHGADRQYVNWTHAALIVDRDGTLIEAVGKGVTKSSLDNYTGSHYKIFRIKASDEDRRQVVDFAGWVEEHHGKYGRLTFVSIALTLLTGSKLAFFIDGQFVCSGLVATALERTGCIFNRSAAHIGPADLAKYFDPAQPHHQAA
ncbi:MAG: hypothetical protein ACRDTE_15015 [Pseudonocardiaceae bacterium]